jgi:uncharacterized protein YigA (DUF484 family)
MSLQQRSEPSQEYDVDKIVVQYLRTHPDFFDTHLHLLRQLRVSHPTGSAVSLIERQVEALRDENAKLEQRLAHLLTVARENDALYGRMQQLTLALLDAPELSDLFAALDDGLRSELPADFVEVRLVTTGTEPADAFRHLLVDSQDPALDVFRNFFRSGRAICGRLLHRQLQFLFPERADEVASACLIPLQGKDFCGLLAIGSRDRERFQPGMGTLFLSHMGQVVSRTLQAHWNRSDTNSA